MNAGRSEIESSLLGTLEIVPRGEDALRHFDFSVGGFWRSFGAAFMVLPVALLIYFSDHKLWLEQRPDVAVPNLAVFLAIDVTGFVAHWALFAVAMAVLCRQFHMSQRYVPLMVVFNWSNIIVALLLLPSTALYYFGLISVDMARLGNFAAYFIAILYRLRIAEVTLQIPATSAIAVPLIYVAINISTKALAGAVQMAIGGA